MSPSGDILDHFSFEMNDSRYEYFKNKIPLEVKIAFEAFGIVYMVSNKLKSLGFEHLTIAHLKHREGMTALIMRYSALACGTICSIWEGLRIVSHTLTIQIS